MNTTTEYSSEPTRTIQHDGESSRRRCVAALVVLTILTVAAYQNSLAAPFVFDDQPNIVENALIRSLLPLPRFFKETGRPVGFFSFALNYANGGTNVFGYHVVNLAIHVSAGILLFWLVLRLSSLPGNPNYIHKSCHTLAFSVAAIWAVHPLQTQSVTYTIQRFECLMGLFAIVFLCCLVASTKSRFAWHWQVAGGAAVWLGMGCKESMLMVPLVGLLVDRAFLSTTWRETVQRRWLLHSLATMAAAAMLVWRVWAYSTKPSTEMGFGMTEVTWWGYLRTQPEVLLHYLRLVVWPNHLSIDYGWPIEDDPMKIYGLGAIILVLLAASLIAWVHWPRIGVLALSVFLILGPTSSFLPIRDLAFEHRMYLALAPLVVLLVLAARWIGQRMMGDERMRKRASVILLLVIITGLCLRTSVRNRDYSDPVRLWSKAAHMAPHHPRPHLQWGSWLMRRGRSQEAIAQIEYALRLDPDYGKGHHGLAVALASQGRDDEAAEHYQRAIELRPVFFNAHLNYANLCARQERFLDAERLYRIALQIRPGHATAHCFLGAVMEAQENPHAAIDEFRWALRIAPDHAQSIERLTWILATSPDQEIADPTAAMRMAERLLNFAGSQKSPSRLDVAAAACAANEDYRRAAALADSGADYAEANGNIELARAIRGRAALYRARQSAVTNRRE